MARYGKRGVGVQDPSRHTRMSVRNPKRDQRIFRKTAGRTRVENTSSFVYRGGIRL